jgi:hypothetical protein
VTLRWRLGHQYDPEALAMANRHYSRVSPSSPKFMPPGRPVVLVAVDAAALWACSWPKAEMVNRAFPGAWLNTHFRRESGPPASVMIRSAVAVTRSVWGDPPDDGLITLIDREKVRPTKVRGRDVWGWTYLKAGFVPAGETKKRRLLILRLLPDAMPEPEPEPAFEANRLEQQVFQFTD